MNTFNYWLLVHNDGRISSLLPGELCSMNPQPSGMVNIDVKLHHSGWEETLYNIREIYKAF